VRTTSKDIRPAESVFQELLSYKIAIIKNNRYVYAPEFEETVAELRRNPPGKIQQLRYGKQAVKISNTIVLYITSFSRSRRNIENLVFAYTILQIHFKRLNLEWPRDDLPFILYATWYLNDNEPEVLVLDEDLDETP